MRARRVGGQVSFALAASLLLSGLLGLLAVGSATAQGTVFPSPVVGVVEDAEDGAGAAITAVYATGDRPSTDLVVVVSNGMSSLPEGSRVSALFGDPDGERVRVSLVLEGDEAVGLRERGDGTIWAADGSAEVAVTDDDQALLPLGEVGDASVLWGELAIPDADVRPTPFFSAGALLGTEPASGRLTGPTEVGVVGSDGIPTGAVARLDSVPSADVAGETVTVSDPEPAPVEVGGVGVTEVRDYLRVVPDFSAGGQSPYFVSIDHATRAVVFWDGTSAIPTPVTAAEETWLSDPLEVDEAGGYTVSFARTGLFEAIGADAATVGALGISRVVMLEDGSQLVAEGGVATLDWFDEGGLATQPASTTTAPVVPTTQVEQAREPSQADEEAGSSVGSTELVVLGAAALALLLGVVAIWAGLRARRREADLDLWDLDEDEAAEAAGSGDDHVPSTSPDIPAQPAPQPGPPVRQPERPVPQPQPPAPREHPATREQPVRMGGPEPEVVLPAAGPSSAPAGEGRQRRPDEALDALNRLIDELDLPGGEG